MTEAAWEEGGRKGVTQTDRSISVTFMNWIKLDAGHSAKCFILWHPQKNLISPFHRAGRGGVACQRAHSRAEPSVHRVCLQRLCFPRTPGVTPLTEGIIEGILGVSITTDGREEGQRGWQTWLSPPVTGVVGTVSGLGASRASYCGGRFKQPRLR